MLSKLTIQYAEASEQNGVIIALDQEKAYDKIAHDYLWEIMAACNIHNHFINTVKALYNQAQTIVIINGELSEPYTVTRGVRQGNPLSCLLFNIAIEPLACMLHKSNIQGLHIPGSINNLITKLFADDTTVYLSEKDSFDKLQQILTEWCIASRAKFNIEKTKCIPIGTKKYRETFYQLRQLNKHNNKIPSDIHIVQEGEAIHSLGCWIGNNIKGVFFRLCNQFGRVMVPRFNCS